MTAEKGSGGRAPREVDVSVVIVNYNAGGELIDCLETVRAQRFGRNYEILVVDNASKDNSLLMAQDRFGEVRVIENDENRGYAAALNQGIKATSGTFVLALNFDVRLDPDYLDEIVRAIESDPQVGSATGKLLKYRTGDYAVLDSTGINFYQMFPTDRGENKKDIGQYELPESMFGPSGAAALYRREMLEDVRIGEECFDEDFFQFVEDVDLAWRAQTAGWKCLYHSGATAVHKRGATRRRSKKLQAQYYKLGYRNRYLTIIKNLHRSIYRGHRKVIRRAETRNFLRVWKRYGFATAAGSVIGALRLYRKMKTKRRAVQAKTRVEPVQIERFIYV